MSDKSEKIQSRADVMRFFIHLLYDLKFAFTSDWRFDDFARITKKRGKFTESECQEFGQRMDECRKWCAFNGENIYQIAQDTRGFPSFLGDHIRITDKKEMKKFAQEFMYDDFDPEKSVALHTYGGCYWIEESIYEGKPLFQCIIENTNPWSGKLRDVEVELYEWSEPKPTRKLAQRR